MDSMGYDQWRDRSIEAMETSWKNSSMEDMELDESGHLSPKYRPSPHLLPSTVDINPYVFSASPAKTVSTNTLSLGWKKLSQTLNTVSAFKTTDVKSEIYDRTGSICNSNPTHIKLKTQVDRAKYMRSLCDESPNKRRKPHENRSIHVKECDSNVNSKVKQSICCVFSKFLVIVSLIILFSSMSLHFYIQSGCKEIQDFNESSFRKRLQDNLFGQELAVKIVPELLSAYLTSLRENSNTKPLVLSIHGWTGVGKNYISRLISSHFNSKTVTKFVIPMHFPHEENEDLSYNKIVNWMNSNITKCCVNIFLFDEMDKASSGVVSGLQSAIINQSNNSISDTPVIFLLLSNSKGTDINRVVFSSGKSRSELSMHDDFEDVFHEPGSWFSILNSNNLIDYFIPFLPLEKHHIRQCIMRDVQMKKLKLTDSKMGEILGEMSFLSVPGTSKQYSKTGCKRVSDKVDLVMYVSD